MNDVDGFEVPLHRSLTERNLLGGIPRGAVIVLWTATLGLTVSTQNYFLLAVGGVLHSVLASLTKTDSYFLEVFRNYMQGPNRLDIQKEKGPSVTDCLPWAMIVAPGVIEQKSGLLQKTVEFRGPDLASSTRSGLVAIVARINNAFRRLDEGWSIFVEAQRNFSNEYPKSVWPDFISEALDEERRRAFEKEGSHFDSRYFLTVVYAPPTEKQEKLRNLFFGESAQNEQRERVISHFLRETENILGLLRENLPFLHELSDDETLTYLHSTISTKRHPIKTPEVPMYLDAILPDQAIECGEETKLGDYWLKTATIRAFPGQSTPGLLNSLNALAFEYRWVSRYLVIGKQKARAEIMKYKKRWYGNRKSLGSVVGEMMTNTESIAVDVSAERKAFDTEGALIELEEGIANFGYFTATVTVWGKTAEEANHKIKEVESVVNSSGFSTQAETFNSTEAWLSSLPGDVISNVRRPIINSLNLAHLMPLAAVWAGPERNAHLQAPVHFIANTTGSTPFRFSTHVGDVGHTLILGPTGSGKSTLLSLMALQWLRYRDAQVYIFDKGGSARAATLAVGGEYIIPGKAEAELSFQPLRWIDEEAERVWASEWLANILSGQGYEVSHLDKKKIWEAVISLAASPPNQRTFSVFHGLLQSQELRVAFSPFVLNGPHGQLLDANKDSLSLGCFQTFEIESLLDSKAIAAPVLSYLFHRLEKRFLGAPTLLILDEAWLYLDHPLFREKIREWLKVLRKSNVSVVFSTQSISDATNSPIAPILLESCLTKIFLANHAAKDPETIKFYTSLGLNERQVEIISRATPKREYYYHSALGNRLFELALGPVAQALCCSGSKDDHRNIDSLLRSDNPQKFGREFLKQKGVVL